MLGERRAGRARPINHSFANAAAPVPTAELKLADVRTQVALSVFTDFDYSDLDVTDPNVVGAFTPNERHAGDLTELLAEVTAWSHALSVVRNIAGEG